MLSAETYDFVLRGRRLVNATQDSEVDREELAAGYPTDVAEAVSTLLLPVPSLLGRPLGVLQLINRQGAMRFDEADVSAARE